MPPNVSKGAERCHLWEKQTNKQTALRTHCQAPQPVYMPAKLARWHSHLCRSERSSTGVKVVLEKGEAKQMRL